MSIRFIHSADWQLGKRFGSVADLSKQEALRTARFHAIERLATIAREKAVDFVLVAGDLFDSPTASKSTISQALGKIGAIPVPVYVIPGNHDHAGPDSFWEQDFFHSEQAHLAPNLHVLLQPTPVILEGKAVILPCPLLRRYANSNPLAWVGAAALWNDLPTKLPRIILGHGTVQEFGSARDAEDDSRTVNFLDLSILDEHAIDYIALGDWHGTKQVGSKAWYSGAFEPDRFPKGEAYQSGLVLVVDIESRGAAPSVAAELTGSVRWHEVDNDFQGSEAMAAFERRLDGLLEDRVQRDALRLDLSGHLSLEDDVRLSTLLERYEVRSLRFELRRRPDIVPSEDEIRTLAGRSGDPLIAAVAAKLQDERSSPTPDLALEGLRQLFAGIRDVESARGGR
jgi:DNA repair exonuclease SbcCD nuclease subunit